MQASHYTIFSLRGPAMAPHDIEVVITLCSVRPSAIPSVTKRDVHCDACTKESNNLSITIFGPTLRFFTEISFDAHGLIFLSQLLCCDNGRWSWSHCWITSLRFFIGLELAHTIRFFITDKFSDGKAWFSLSILYTCILIVTSLTPRKSWLLPCSVCYSILYNNESIIWHLIIWFVNLTFPPQSPPLSCRYIGDLCFPLTWFIIWLSFGLFMLIYCVGLQSSGLRWFDIQFCT